LLENDIDGVDYAHVYGKSIFKLMYMLNLITQVTNLGYYVDPMCGLYVLSIRICD